MSFHPSTKARILPANLVEIYISFPASPTESMVKPLLATTNIAINQANELRRLYFLGRRDMDSLGADSTEPTLLPGLTSVNISISRALLDEEVLRADDLDPYRLVWLLRQKPDFYSTLWFVWWKKTSFLDPATWDTDDTKEQAEYMWVMTTRVDGVMWNNISLAITPEQGYIAYNIAMTAERMTVVEVNKAAITSPKRVEVSEQVIQRAE